MTDFPSLVPRLGLVVNFVRADSRCVSKQIVKELYYLSIACTFSMSETRIIIVYDLIELIIELEIITSNDSRRSVRCVLKDRFFPKVAAYKNE